MIGRSLDQFPFCGEASMGRGLVAGLIMAGLMAGSASAAPAKIYSAKDGGESVSVEVAPDGGGWRMTIIRKGANGCDVKVEGPVTLKGPTYHMTADSTGKACDVQLTPKPGFAEFLENKCEAHGDMCRLDDLPILEAK
jgi:hypothetical protein